MSFLGKIFSLGVGNIVESVSKSFDLSGEKKRGFKLQLETLLQKRDTELEETIRTELMAKERVLVAELTQGDNFTKRARPSVVYAGLLFAFLNHILMPYIAHFRGLEIPDIALPLEFWVGWTGIVGTWSIGRTLEKRGKRGRLVSMITGSKLLDEGEKAA